jgi:hypothetical protein
MTKTVNEDLSARKRELLMLRLKRSAAASAAVQPQPALAPASRTGPLPLSFAQQRLWFLDQLDHTASAAYHLPAALRLSGPLDRAALRAALDRVVVRHEILRTTFAIQDGEPAQVIGAATLGFSLAEMDLATLDAGAQQDAIERIGRAEVAQLFDLAAGPLVRGQLLRLSESEHVLFITHHHIVTDGWSIGVLVHEVGALYAALAAGRPDPLPPLALQYADYAVWQRGWLRGERLLAQTAFWTAQLAGVPALLDLPTDRPRPAVRGSAGAAIQFTLGAGLTGAVRALAQRHGATLFMTLLAAWAGQLARLSGQGDVVVGTAVANRRRTEVESMLGFFVNTVALRVRFEDDLDVGALLAQVRATTTAGYDHQDLPFEQVVEALQPVRSLSHTPIFQTMFSMNNTPGNDTAPALAGLRIAGIAQEKTTSQFDLSLSVTDAGSHLVAGISYATDLFDGSTVQRIADGFACLLTAMTTASATDPVGGLDLLGAAE